MQPSKRILWKRARSAMRAAFDEATQRMAASVASIVNDNSVDKNDMLARSFGQFQEHLDKLMKRKTSLADIAALHAVFKNDSERSEPDLSDSDAGYGGKTRRQYEAEAADRTQALSEGEEDNRRDDDDDDRDESDDNEKDTTMKTLLGLAKRYGWQSVCKNFVESGTGSFSETEVTEFLTAVAQKSYPDLTPDVAFAKAYSASTADGELMRRTTIAARDAGFVSKVGGSTPHFLADGAVPTMSPGKATLKPRSSGLSGKPAQQGVNNPRLSIAQLQALIDAQRAEADDDEAGEGGEHYAKLLKLAEEAHAAQPEQTVAQHFAKIFSSREHRGLAEAERLANRPRASW